MPNLETKMKINGGDPLSEGSGCLLEDRELYIDTNGVLWSGKGIETYPVQEPIVVNSATTSIHGSTDPKAFSLNPTNVDTSFIGPFKFKSYSSPNNSTHKFQLSGSYRRNSESREVDSDLVNTVLSSSFLSNSEIYTSNMYDCNIVGPTLYRAKIHESMFGKDAPKDPEDPNDPSYEGRLYFRIVE